VALNAAVRAGVDYGRGSHGLHLPIKKPGEEIGGLSTVAASDFEVHYGLTHVVSFQRKCSTS